MAIKVRRFKDTVEQFGVGDCKRLTPSQIGSLQRVFNDFRNYLSDNCMSHALYRGSFRGVDNTICVSMFGSDVEGNVKELEFYLSLKDNTVYSRGIVLPDERLAADKLLRLITNLDSLIPLDIGMVDIPFEGAFRGGVVTGFVEGGYLIAVEDNADAGYYAE